MGGAIIGAGCVCRVLPGTKSRVLGGRRILHFSARGQFKTGVSHNAGAFARVYCPREGRAENKRHFPNLNPTKVLLFYFCCPFLPLPTLPIAHFLSQLISRCCCFYLLHHWHACCRKIRILAPRAPTHFHIDPCTKDIVPDFSTFQSTF